MSGVRDDPSADDLLIEKLRARAHDPAWRFDKAPVPAEWVAHRYGKEHFDLARKRSFTFDSNGMIYFPAGSAEAVEYYQDSPREPPFPPVAAAEVDNAERSIGLRDEQPEYGVTHVTSSLRRWLWTWADGGNVWDEALRGR